MIPIKFRARNLKTDELITGYGIYADPPAEPDAKGRIKETWVRRTFIITTPYSLDKSTCWIDVKPESIEQLVGYDSDGQEIYEGDTVVLLDEKGKECISDTASLSSWVQNIREYIESENKGSKERGYDLDFTGCKIVVKKKEEVTA